MKKIACLTLMAMLLAVALAAINAPQASLAAPSVPTRPFRTISAARPQSASVMYLPLMQSAGTPSGTPPTPPPTSPTLPPATPPPGTGATPFFLPYTTDSAHNTTDPDVLIDAAGGVHVAYHDYAPVGDQQTAFYAYCAAGAAGGCTRATDFVMTTLAPVLPGKTVWDANLALDPAGHPRMLLTMSDGFLYAVCDANCTTAASWTITRVIEYNNVSDYHSRRFVVDQQGHPSFVYRDDNNRDHEGTWYAFCTSTCTDTTQWYETRIGDVLVKPSLALTTDGHPRFAANLLGASDGQLVYLECNAACDDGANWEGVILPTINPFYSAYSLQVGTDNLPRLALSPGEVSSTSMSNRLYYLTCTTACGNVDANDWHAHDTGLTDKAGDAVALALDSQNRPRIAYDTAEDGSGSGMAYATCDSDCAADNAPWQPQVFDTAAALNTSDPVTTTVICSNPTMPTWSLGYWASLALDGSGHPRIAYDAHHLWLCSYTNGLHVETDIAWARFAAIK